MKPSGHYTCVLCNKTCDSLHEIFYGTGNRKLSIKYNLQVPLCYFCNSTAVAHGVDSLKYKKHFCNLLGISYEAANLAINSKGKREYLEKVSAQCAEKIREYAE